MKKICYFLLIFLFFLYNSDLFAEIKDVIITGNKKITKEAILNIINTNDELNEENLDQILLKLYKTGLFMDINLVFDEKTKILHCTFVENKIVRNYQFNGTKNINNPQLKKLVTNQYMKIFNYYQFEQIAKSLHKYYIDNGYMNIEILKEIKDIDEDIVDVTLTVKKHSKPKIESIFFTGNNSFTREKLIEVMFFKETSLMRILSPKISFDKAKQEINTDLLTKFYNNRGFIDFRVVKTTPEFDLARSRTKITIEIEEGNQYSIDEVKTNSEIQLSDYEKSLLIFASGDIYNQKQIDIAIKKLKESLNLRKYYSEISTDFKKTTHGTIDITFNINETRSNYIEKIVIFGNTRTQDDVIRGQITLHEGDIFDVSEIQSSYRRIYNLGFFESVDLGYYKNQSGKIILTVTVVEKKTGEINIGGGYSSLNGFFAKLLYQQANLMGNGNSLDFAIERGSHNFLFNTSYYKAHIFNSLFGGGAGLFYDHSTNDVLDYKTREYGGKLMTSMPLSYDLSLGLRYILKISDIYDVGKEASDYIKNSQGKTITSAIGYRINYDKRDVANYPTNGYLLSFSQENAGLGGDKYFISTEIGGNFYKKLIDIEDSSKDDAGVILQIRGNCGYLSNYNNYNLRIDDRYFFSDVRGFQMISGISPKDKDGKAVGGDFYYNGSFQIEVPIDLVKIFDVKAHIFLDYGNLMSVKKFSLNPRIDEDDNLMYNVDKIRLSAGFGLSINTPFAPIEIDFAAPIRYDKSDIINYVYFAIGKKL